MPAHRVVAIEPLIITVRGIRVILSSELARIYGVETKALNQAVKQNADRFPADFAFRLPREEVAKAVPFKVTTCDLKASLRLRTWVADQTELAARLENFERHVGKHDRELKAIIQAIRQLIAPTAAPQRRIGVHSSA